MRKSFLMVLAVALVAAMAAPALADLSTGGFIRAKGRVEQNYRFGGLAGTQGGAFILPGKDVSTAGYVEQRTRFFLDWKSENVGGRALFELDFGAWGDSAYTVARNQGGGLEGDSINLETKNIYLWFNVPNTSLKVTAGLQNQTDSFGGMIFGYADMSGIFLNGKYEPVSWKLGWAKFAEGSTTVDDDVDLYVAEAKFAPSKDSKLGIDFYMIRDASGSTAAGSGAFNTNLNTIGRAFADYGYGATAFTYKPTNMYYIGVDGSYNAGPALLSGYFFYQFGKVDLLGGTVAGTPVIAGDSFDVKGMALDLRAEGNLGPGKGFLEFAYVTGSDENDDDFKAPITASNYALAGSYPLTSMDMQILFPNIDDINNFGGLVPDVQNKGRGILAAAAGYRMNFNAQTAGKFGIGYVGDLENFVGTNVSGVAIKKHSAIEINANVNYALVKGLDLGLYAAYAFLDEWEDYGASSVGVANMTRQADDIYKLFWRINYAF